MSSRLDDGQKIMLAEATNLPLRIQLDWLDNNGINAKKVAAHCNCSVGQIQGLKSGKWREPASLRMEYKILELVEVTYFSLYPENKGRRPPSRLSTYCVPKPNFMPHPPAKDPYDVITILNYYRNIGFTQRIVCEITGISERQFEQALLGNSSIGCRRAIANSLDRYQNYLF
ncbi:MAG: hypothetical protein Q4F60_03025 [Candidatus Saccharibacteria bacterium]|nr:hypothetical protein [Candidatus Saccharibacteria bacterium]